MYLDRRSILKNKDGLKYHSTYCFDDGNVFILVRLFHVFIVNILTHA